MKTNIIIKSKSPIIIKSNNDKFINELLDQLKVVKFKFYKNYIILNIEDN